MVSISAADRRQRGRRRGRRAAAAAAACRLPLPPPHPPILPSLPSPGRVDAMELSSLTPELPKLLAEMGVKYDPERLGAALSSRPAGALEGSSAERLRAASHACVCSSHPSLDADVAC